MNTMAGCIGKYPDYQFYPPHRNKHQREREREREKSIHSNIQFSVSLNAISTDAFSWLSENGFTIYPRGLVDRARETTLSS